MAAKAIDFVQKKPNVHFRSLESLEHADSLSPPETFVFENLKMRPRSMSHHLSSTKVPSRKWLKMQASFWRSMMSLGMMFYDYAPPKPPRWDFIRKIPTNTVPVELYFYTPPDYREKISSGHHYPVVVNYHGGGFCLGHPTDDRYWARVVVQTANAVFVSVGYRRAPEHPFPVPVDDGVNALLYLAKNADMLGLDTTRTALSGFSAGANLSFAVPMRLKYYTFRDSLKEASSETDISQSASASSSSSPTKVKNSSTTDIPLLHRPPMKSLTSTFTPHPTPYSYPSNLKITTTIAWYPLLDWTTSRSAKKRASINPKKTLPKVFTDLFDYSYLPPPDDAGSHCSPYASPGLAPDDFLKSGLPEDIQVWLCEWDMLLAEGQKFATRLEGQGKKVDWTIIPGVPHGWDKSPNPWRDQKGIDDLYETAAARLKRVFEP